MTDVIEAIDSCCMRKEALSNLKKIINVKRIKKGGIKNDPNGLRRSI
jgi:hypothetical protein